MSFNASLRAIWVARFATPVAALWIATIATTSVANAQSAQVRPLDCSLKDGEKHSVVRVLDGETLVIDGGLEVRLIGALAPRSSDASGEDGPWTPAVAAAAGLEEQVKGRTIELGFAGRRSDRYGRLLAQVFAMSPGGTDAVWVQGEMLKQGLARAYILEGSTGCLAELLSHERTARDASRGLWAQPAYAVRASDGIDDLLLRRGTFQLVEGRVRAVSDLKTATYINFGEDVRQDFTVSIRGSAAKRSLMAIGLDPQTLVGRVIRVRGWVERRGGPLIEIHHGGEIELTVDGAATAPGPASEAVPPAARRSRARSQRAAERPAEQN
jgi:micrococcal nuclease